LKAYQVFARMTPERVQALLEGLRKEAPGVYTQALGTASVWLRARPQFVMKQSPEKRARFVREALARVATNVIAEEVLAAYFLQVRKPLLVEWLDAIGLEHEEGSLKADAPPEPERSALEKAVSAFRAGDDAEDRQLLLQAFAAQSAIEWPALEALLGVA
jgi:hypothetical protein